MAWPAELHLDAWAGGPTGLFGPVAAGAGRWARRSPLPDVQRSLFPQAPADPRAWRDPRVGWGLVLADDDQVPATERSTAVDAPEPIRDLLADRPGSPVLRAAPARPGTLRRYEPNGNSADLSIAASEFGTAAGCIPRYLLIVGSPARVPWSIQFVLNARFAVGRLDLDDAGLANYVAALRTGWAGMAADPFAPLVWATDHGPTDITATMKAEIARPVFARLQADPDIPGARFLGDPGPATLADLRTALHDAPPGLIVTTSHGATGNAVRPPTLDTLGLPVDDELNLVAPGALLEAWEPNGAIWYAHACCSAGSSALTVYHGLFEPGSDVGSALAEVTALGDQVAPLPSALLGHRAPLRAFVGHVEPTFDWTFVAPQTGQALTSGIRIGLYDRLYQRTPYPVGLAFEEYFAPIGPLSALRDDLVGRYNAGGPADDPELLAAQLGSRDRMSTVILGDPTVVVHPGP